MFTDEFADALGELDSDPDLIPASFRWNGADYACFASGATKGGRLESYGWGIDMDLVIIVRASLFADSRPERLQTLVYREVTYRVDRVLTGPGDSFIRYGCVNANRGA